MTEETPLLDNEAVEAIPEEVKPEEVKPEEVIPEEATPQIVPPSEPVVMKKKRGHRLKDPNTDVLTNKTACKACNRTLSKHTLRYSHKCAKKLPKIIEEALPAAPVITEEAKNVNNIIADHIRQKEPQPRRVVDLDSAIRHDDENVKYIVQNYVQSIRQSHHNLKMQKYRNLLTGRL